MSSFPGPQKNKMDAFIYHLYEGHQDKKLSKQDILHQVEAAPFAADTQVFFEELPDRSYNEDELIKQLNDIITRRGRAHAIGGTLQKLNSIPPDWQQAYNDYFGPEHHH